MHRAITRILKVISPKKINMGTMLLVCCLFAPRPRFQGEDDDEDDYQEDDYANASPFSRVLLQLLCVLEMDCSGFNMFSCTCDLSI
jgi:hypothetical protein